MQSIRGVTPTHPIKTPLLLRVWPVLDPIWFHFAVGGPQESQTATGNSNVTTMSIMFQVGYRQSRYWQEFWHHISHMTRTSANVWADIQLCLWGNWRLRDQYEATLALDWSLGLIPWVPFSSEFVSYMTLDASLQGNHAGSEMVSLKRLFRVFLHLKWHHNQYIILAWTDFWISPTGPARGLGLSSSLHQCGQCVSAPKPPGPGQTQFTTGFIYHVFMGWCWQQEHTICLCLNKGN